MTIDPLLIRYYNIALEIAENDSQYSTYWEPSNWVNSDEWHYIQSNLERNILILKRLEEKNLLKDTNNIIDCGIGLGTALYDLYLQSKDLQNKKFTFTGIEKWKPYLNYLNENLLYLWDNQLKLINEDIMNIDYSDYNIIYIYAPFKDTTKLFDFYQKLANEIQPGSLIIENRNAGFGENNILTEVVNIYPMTLQDRVVFYKS